jgi:hypothetical protein
VFHNSNEKETLRMKIKYKARGSVAPEGFFVMTVSEVKDLGKMTSQYGTRESLRVYGHLDTIDPQTGLGYTVNRMFSSTVGDRSKFAAFVKVCTGRDTEQCLDANGDFDTDILIGQRCVVQIKHKVTQKGTYANIINFQPLPAGSASARPAIPLANFDEGNKPNGSDPATAFPAN